MRLRQTEKCTKEQCLQKWNVRFRRNDKIEEDQYATMKNAFLSIKKINNLKRDLKYSELRKVVLLT